MKKTLLVPPKYLKVLCQRWLILVLSMVISISFLSLVYYLIKKIQNAQKETPLNIAYVMDENWQLIYSKLLVNLVEEVAHKNWEQAINLAKKIEPLPTERKIEVSLLENKLKQWNQALDYIENIPPESSLIHQREQKQKEYAKNRDFIDYQLENNYSKWVESIAENSPISKSNIMITVCDFVGVCRRFQGGKEVKSPASLIKIPVAVAVMKKIQNNQIKIGQKIKVISGNYTEDASDIIVGKDYSLKYLLFRTINQSSNIATNQLIDYLGWGKINDYLHDNDYQKTYIGYKVVGERTYPNNAGCCSNRLTTDELTQMMIDIYTIDNPENKALIKFLAAQEDQTIGYAAFEDEEITWLGEKTGRHSRFKGTTVATQIHQKKYIITVAVTQGTADIIVSNIVKNVAQKIHKSGDLENTK